MSLAPRFSYLAVPRLLIYTTSDFTESNNHPCLHLLKSETTIFRFFSKICRQVV
ncbi:hypothetical protein BRADI_2g15874v3 [Brachypodium distachyon]|uniref:Uncharacterized protein n=1 Tax=Brachypodium distachyon TaxID=15368 RepID=A0A0Q3K217_BRADI|nr:hypothetical protein BRADI_2g15874v3 [Brachypodium distachyon]